MPGNKTYGTLRCWTHEHDVESTDQLGEPVVAKPIDSYLAQWGQSLSSDMGAQLVSGVTDITGTDRGLETEQGPELETAAGNTGTGIVLGNDGTDETITDNALGNALISEFDHGSCDVGTGNVAGSSITVDVTRTLTNNSGSLQTIKEVGVRASLEVQSGGNETFLLLRDALGSPFDVSNGDNTTQEYSLEYEV